MFNKMRNKTHTTMDRNIRRSKRRRMTTMNRTQMTSRKSQTN